MPLHLLPARNSRRQFLRQLAVAGGGATSLLSGVRSAGAAEDGGEKGVERWALLSDTHIAADPDLMAREIRMAETLKQVVAEVVAEADSLDGVLIDGDCAYDDGQPGDYATLAEILEPLTETGLSVHFTLGNHDDREAFFDGFPKVPGRDSLVDGKHISVVEGARVNWVMLDSLRFVNQVEGEFGKAQLEWLDRWLAENSSRPAVLVGHHYPQVFRTDVIPSKEEEIKISGLVDSEPFLEIVHRHSHVQAYLYGHSHDWKTRTDGKVGFHQVNLPPTAYVFKADRPNGWVRATLTAESMRLELRALDPEHPEHGKITTLAWR